MFGVVLLAEQLAIQVDWQVSYLKTICLYIC